LKCPICRQGETSPGLVTFRLQRAKTTVIFEQVPAEVCENCGEHYLSQVVTDKLLARAEEVVKNGAELEILSFAA
jgi:YgiT-type zinc finger domain-containing protein